MEFIVLVMANYLLVVLLFVFPWLYIRCRSDFFRLLIAVVSAWLITVFIKDFFYVPRPFIRMHTQPLIHFLLDGSFPSSHAAISFTVAAFLFPRYLKIGLLACFLAVLISAGRVLSGVHTVRDLIGGFLVGTVAVYLSARVKLSHHRLTI